MDILLMNKLTFDWSHTQITYVLFRQHCGISLNIQAVEYVRL